jgi:hypothetical protein
MKISLVAALALILVSIPFAGAISPPTVTFIPEKISIDSSFIMIADPHPLPSEPVVTVRFIAFGTSGFGLIPFNGNKYVCYFSNTDSGSNCGMNFFPGPSYGVPYEIEVNASTPDPDGQTESTFLEVEVGGIPISSEISVYGSNVYIKAWAGANISGTISYKVYESAGLSVVQSGSLVKNNQIFGYSTNITLSSGEYYIAFSAASATDFGGGVSRVVVGSGPAGSSEVQADSIVYSPVINPGQEFSIETFRITNLGTDNLTSLSITVPSQISTYLTITPKKTTIEPNESVYMTVTIRSVQSSMNISTFATLLSGSTEIKQIPVELRISVIGSTGTCEGKNDKELCMGGICCGGVCRTGGAECCSTLDCGYGEECSSVYKCVQSVTPGECSGMSDMAACTGGICCLGTCIAGGECCTSMDCGYGEECSYSYICTASVTNECEGQSDGTACSSGYCCSGYCQECCTSMDCTGAGEICSGGMCMVSDNGGTTSPGIDVTTIALIAGGVVAAAVVGFFVFQKFVKKKGKEGDEDFDEGGGKEEEEDEFSDEDFY